MKLQLSEGSDVLTVVLGLPVVGILMGGIYSLPAMRVTDCRDPAYTLLLSTGLSVTVIGLGVLGNVSMPWLSAAWACAMLLLVIRRLFGRLDHNVERFGMVHAVTLVGMFWVVWFSGPG